MKEAVAMVGKNSEFFLIDVLRTVSENEEFRKEVDKILLPLVHLWLSKI